MSIFSKFSVTVLCKANQHKHTYTDCVKIEKGMYWDDDLEVNVCGVRLFFADGSHATFRDGFEIVINC